MADKKQTETREPALGETTLKQIWLDFVADIKAKQSAPIVSLEDYQKTDEFKSRRAAIHEGWAKRPPGRKFMGITFAGKKPKA